MESIEKLIKHKDRLWHNVIHLAENLLFFKFYIAVYEELDNFEEDHRKKFKEQGITLSIYFTATNTYFFRLTKYNFYDVSLICIRRLTDKKSNKDNISLEMFIKDIKNYSEEKGIFNEYETTFKEYKKLEPLIEEARVFINQNIAHIDNNQKDHSNFIKEILPNIEKITKGLQPLFQAFMGILENKSYSAEYDDLNFPSFLFHYEIFNTHHLKHEQKVEIENFIKAIETNYIKKWKELKKEIYSTKYLWQE